MLLDRLETTGRVTTEWHQCSVCSKVLMHSELDPQHSSSARWGKIEESGSDKKSAAYSRRQGIGYA